MTKTKKKLPLLSKITITDVAAEGKAIAKIDNMIIFTSFVVPGDVVDLQVTKKKHNYLEARATFFHEYSDKRSVAVCEHFGICGGCKWQILPYKEQLYYKENQVLDNLTRIGKLQITEVRPIIGSTKTEFYRNKLEYTFSNKKWLTFEEMDQNITQSTMNAVGFHIPNQFDKVLDIKKCWLQDDISNQIRNEVRRYAIEKNLTFFDLRKQNGFLRTLIIRNNSKGEWMVIVVFFYEDKKMQEELLENLSEKFPQITSLLFVVNSKANDTITDQKIHIFKGDDFIYEQMEGIRFKIGPKSFYQTNTDQAYKLYKATRNSAQLTGNELVYDLYTGTGTIANFIAKDCRTVIGIEYVPEAIADAIENSRINGIQNTKFFAGDMKDILNEEFIQHNGTPDVIITDPPRAGMHPDVVKTILLANPERIVYVSCNPATQARDLALLTERYEITNIQPVDMFPHTHHVENIVGLRKKQNNQ